MRHTIHPPRHLFPTVITGPNYSHQLLYFTSSSLTADGERVYFISDRDGQPNIHSRDLRSGHEVRHSDNRDSTLKSYVYFDGRPYHGLGRASASLDPQTGAIYYIQGRQIMVSDVDGRQRVLAEYPADQMTAFTHVSADGRRLCVPTVDARALEGDQQLTAKPSYDIDARIQAEGLSSWLRVYDTATGAALLEERVPRAWVTHVQFSPLSSDILLYNHEWPGDCGIRRMWLWDGQTHRRLRGEGPGRTSADWVCHEMWEPDGRGIIYHGALRGPGSGGPFVGRVELDADEPVEIILPTGSRRYGHFTPSPAGELITDGYYEAQDNSAGWGGAWLSQLHIDWPERRIEWTPLCRHGSSWTSQDDHPHPIFAPDGRSVWFTSDVSGRRQVWRLEL